ncbi:MAG: GAF domain-containing sensor histidine kinase [Anaerolineales bacterium]|nr:GAF domain-containing sensor histidine kinase [Anaerolineales bacterium]MCB8953871.1 GAF domain-containing sensor histidine kinase [Ardenticatenales bacterium]
MTFPPPTTTAASNGLAVVEATQLKRLIEIAIQLSSTLELKQLLHLVIHSVVELTETEVASILLMDKQTGELHFVAATNETRVHNVVVPLNSIAGWIVLNGKPLILEDVQSDPRFYAGVDDVIGFRTRSLLGVPLMNKGEVIGVLEAINKHHDKPFSEQDAALLMALASQAAVAIENARLFQQSDLIAEILHEFKTPLMTIIAASEMLQQGRLPEETNRQLIGMVYQESGRLSQMTRDFLDWAHLESGRMHLAQENVEIPPLIGDVIQATQAGAAGMNVTITSALPPDTPPLIGDRERLRQVLLNLVTNAIKYNRRGGQVRITVSQQEQELLLSISDSGHGIPAAHLPHLFERFYRVPGNEGIEGSGLGLSISQKIVQEHGGQIEVRSREGEGSTFTCRLPLPA